MTGLENFLIEEVFKDNVAVSFKNKNEAIEFRKFLKSSNVFKDYSFLSLNTLIDNFETGKCFRFSKNGNGWASIDYYKLYNYKIYNFTNFFYKDFINKNKQKNKVRIISF